MRIFSQQKGLHGLATIGIQLLKDASQFRVDTLFGRAALSRFFIPCVTTFKLALLHMNCAKQGAWAVVSRPKGMRLLTHLNCFGQSF